MLVSRSRRIRRHVAGLAVTALAATGAVASYATSVLAVPPGNPAHDVIANLFEWNWNSVATECTTVLGPAGYGAVQVAPPQESISISGHPWWEVYQPVSYQLTSRMGNRAQFAAMVTACHNAGIKVYADAVLNHMTGQGNVGYAGTTFPDKYTYTGLYGTQDFHHTPADCPTAGGIDDYNNQTQVQKCELVGLADLRTESDYVRTTLAGYLNDQISLGVDGFRLDAAKHINAADIAAIQAKLTSPAYLYQEIMPGGAVSPSMYEGIGDVLEFTYGQQLRAAFTGSIASLSTFGQSGLEPSNKSVTFVDNHDTDRNASTLSSKDGATYTLANVYSLARGYGTPQVYASFAFSNNDQSPPSGADGLVTNTDCTSAAWVCTDRTRAVLGMVGWHNAVTGTAVANWWTDGSNAISFSRGSAGFVAINNGSAPITRAFQTGLAAGTYCDVIHATFSAGSCTGAAVVVDAAGNANVTVAAKDSVALHINARVSAGGPATLSPSPSSLSFAATTVGGASATQGVTVSNTGGTSATVSSVAVNGDFTQMNSCATVAAGASCTVSVTFRPTAAGTRTGTLTVTSNAGNNPTAVSLTGAGADSTSNIAVGKSATANSVQQTFAATNSNDGNTSTYWEGAGAYPQWLQIDLGSATSVGRVAVKLPPTWGSRTQTFSVLGSTDGTNFTTLSASASRVFDPSTVNTVTITFSAATVRFVRLNVTANTGAGGGQVAEFQIYPASAGGTSATLAANPASLAFSSTVVNTSSAAQNVTVSNSGSAAGAVSSVTASGDFSQTNTCGTSIPAGGSCTVSVTFRPTTSGSRTGTLTVSSNASNPTLSVALTGTSAPAGNSNLAAGRATSESGHQQTYVAGNAVDGNQATYWEGQANAYPNWLQVDLGSAQTVGRVVLKLPAAWGARTQTLSILGSADGTTWTTLKASAAYTYPAGNVVSIALTGSSQRYVRINITANTGAAGGQVSELEVYSS